MNRARNELPPDRPGDGEDITHFLARHYRRHQAQLAFLLDPARYRFACSGVGGGKSEVGSFEAVRHCLRWPGIAGLIVAPSHRMLNRSTLLSLRNVMRWWGTSLRWEHRKGDNQIVFPDHQGRNGEPSTLFLAHCQDPDTLRGPNIGFFFGDEAALFHEDTWRILVGRTRQPGYPHRGWLCSTPKGTNWLYRTFVQGRDEWSAERRKQYGIHHWTTSDNPLYQEDDSFIEALREVYGEGSDFFRQEVEGAFVSFTGLVYRQWDAERMIVPRAQAPTQFSRLACGIDWGVTSPGAFILLGETSDGMTYLLEEVYERGRIISGLNGGDWLSEAVALKARWPQVKFYADPADANAIQTFVRAGLPVSKAENKRLPGVRACQAALAGDRFRVVADAAPHWMTEIEQYHWSEDSDGNPREDADPAKEFDHALDAWRYAQMALSAPTPWWAERSYLAKLAGEEVDAP